MAASTRGDQGEPGAGLPGVLTQVVVRVDGLERAESTTKVYDVETHGGSPVIVLAPGEAAVLSPDAFVTLTWTAEQGRWQLPVAAARGTRPYGAVWLLSPTGPAQREQRREFFRVRVSTPVVLVAPGEDEEAVSLRAALIDLSEGGVSVLLPTGAAPIAPGTEVEVHLDLDGEPIAPAAVVVRPLALAEGRAGLALRFLDPDRHGDRIRRVAFAEQRRAAARR